MNRVLLEIIAFVFVAALITFSGYLTTLKNGLQSEFESLLTKDSKALEQPQLSIRHGLAAGKWSTLIRNCKASWNSSNSPEILFSTIQHEDYDH